MDALSVTIALRAIMVKKEVRALDELKREITEEDTEKQEEYAKRMDTLMTVCGMYN